MQAEQKTINKTHLLDKIRGNKKQIGLAALGVVLIGFIFFGEFMLQLGLLILIVAALGYFLFRVGLFTFVITFGFLKGLLSLIAFIVAIGLIIALSTL